MSERPALFVFESGDPPLVVIYEDLDDAMELLESLDVAAVEEAFLETGQAVTVSPSDGLLAELRLTDRYDPEHLRSLLRRAVGPSHLADNPAAYAREWLRLDDLDSRRPPLIPRWLYDRYRKGRSPDRGDKV